MAGATVVAAVVVAATVVDGSGGSVEWVLLSANTAVADAPPAARGTAAPMRQAKAIGGARAPRQPVRARPRRIGCSRNRYETADTASVTAHRRSTSQAPSRPVRSGVSHRNSGQWYR